MNVRFERVSKSYGQKQVLRELDLSLQNLRPTCVMGPSGCGKTTLLRILMGLEGVDGGRVTGLEGLRAAPVFQEDRLCDELSVQYNIALVRAGKISRDELDAGIEALGLHGTGKMPAGRLSGGMKRRVAILRALAAEYDMLLLDEPFKGLDDAAKKTAAEYILFRAKGKLIVAATHDSEDACLLGADIVRLPLL